MNDFFINKVVLITGAAGTVGQELLRQLLALNPGEIRALDNNETELFFLKERYRTTSNFSAHLGDIRDPRKLEDVCSGVDLIFHLAAFKHVGLSEYHPFEVVQTNLLGLQNLIKAARRQGVERLLFTSSDKAVHPTNVMGTTKLLGERLITAANIHSPSGPRFSSVRFGNIIGSRGSVIPIFGEQIRQGGPVTITDPSMTRFFMTNQEAVKLVLEASVLACGGEVFVTKMPVIRIVDLAQAMIALLAPAYGFAPQKIPLQFVGVRSGERLYEELLTEEETERTLETDRMFVVLPSLEGLAGKTRYSYPGRAEPASLPHQYNSAQEVPLTVKEIKHFLLVNHILGDFVDLENEVPRPKRRHLHVVHDTRAELA